MCSATIALRPPWNLSAVPQIQLSASVRMLQPLCVLHLRAYCPVIGSPSPAPASPLTDLLMPPYPGGDRDYVKLLVWPLPIHPNHIYPPLRDGCHRLVQRGTGGGRVPGGRRQCGPNFSDQMPRHLEQGVWSALSRKYGPSSSGKALRQRTRAVDAFNCHVATPARRCLAST